MTTSIVCIALLGLLLFVLGLATSVQRGRSERISGTSGDPADPLHKMVRAHGNTAEFAPMLAILIFLVGRTEPSIWGQVFMIGATVSRYSLALGLLLSPTLDRPQPLRFLGALGTYVFGAGLCVLLLLSL
jgi:uncharacterized membrane protein YecN with MAPEG domain